MSNRMSASDFRKKIASGELVVGKKHIESKTIILTDVKENKKIKNATKVTIDNIKFDSKLESIFYQTLINHKINFELKKKYTIIDSFENINGKFQKITWSPDFYIPKINLIIDTKGYADSVFPVKYKMFNALIPNCPRIIFVKAQYKIDMAMFVIKKLLNGHNVEEKYYKALRL